MQTRLSSLIEAVINVAIGFVVSIVITAIVLPAYGHPVSWGDNLQITGIFTAASIVRSYSVRRWFNARLHSASQKLAERFAAFADQEADEWGTGTEGCIAARNVAEHIRRLTL